MLPQFEDDIYILVVNTLEKITKMILNSESLDINPKNLHGDFCFEFKFKGRLTHEDSQKACILWAKEFNQNTREKYAFIWNCSQMSSFEISVKKEWQECLVKYHNRLDMVHVISNNLFIRGAARLMLKLYSVNVILAKNT